MQARKGSNTLRRQVKPKKQKAPSVKTPFRMPTFGAGVPGWVTVVIVIAGVGIGLFFSMGLILPRISGFACTTVTVNGNTHVPRGTVLSALAIDSGTSIFGVAQARLTKSLAHEPWILSVAVVPQIPHGVRISITERTPVALVNLGKVYAIDRTGVCMPLSSDVEAAGSLPLISGMADTVVKTQRMVVAGDMKRLLVILERISNSRSPLSKQVDQIVFCPEGIVRLSFGAFHLTADVDDERIATKMRYIWQIVHSTQTVDAALPDKIDLRYADVAFAQYSE